MSTIARMWDRERAGRVQMSADHDDSGEGLVFVTGFDRSGTTWLSRMFDAHPECLCRTGGHFFNHRVPDLKYLGNRSGRQEMVDSVLESGWWEIHGRHWMEARSLEADFAARVARSMRSFGQVAGVPFVADKSVTQDGPQVRAAFSRAPFVAIVRDGRDACVSFAYAKLRKGHEWKFRDREEGRLEEGYIADHAAAWSAYNRHLSDFADDERCRIIRYEDLLADTAGVMAGVFQFVGLAADVDTVAGVVESTSFERLTGGRRPGQEDAGSSVRKGIAGDWVERFSAEDSDRYVAIAGDTLGRFGYPVALSG